MKMFWSRSGPATIAGLIIVAGFLVISLTNYVISTSSAKKAILTNTLPLTSDNIFSEIQRDLLLPVTVSSLMARDTFLRDWVIEGEQDVPRVVKYLKEIQERYHAVTSFFVSERTHVYYHSGGVLKKVKPDEPRDVWFFRVRQMEAPYEINVDPDMANRDTMTFFINYRVLDYQGGFLGATGVGITVGAVKSLIEHYQTRFGRTVYFVDNQGKVVLHGLNFRGNLELRDRPGLREHLPGLLGGAEYAAEFMDGADTLLLNARYIPELKWVLVVEESAADVLQGFKNTLQGSLVVCALVTLVVVFLNRKTVHYFHDKLSDMALCDDLTGTANRRAFSLLFTQLAAQTKREPEPLSLLIMDMDHFKEVNDRHGHLVGDKVLQQIAAYIKSSVRDWDVICRWGGEEFLVLLKGAALGDAVKIAEHIREGMAGHPFGEEGDPIPLTASFGVTQYQQGDSEASLVGRADRALYLAKDAGRNRVEPLAA